MVGHPLVAQEVVSGESVCKEECKSCHGLKGTPPEQAKAKYKKMKAIGEDSFISALSEDSIVTILTKGIDKNMKSFKDKLSEPEMKAVAAYGARRCRAPLGIWRHKLQRVGPTSSWSEHGKAYGVPARALFEVTRELF